MPAENTDTNSTVSAQDDSLFTSLQNVEGTQREPADPDTDDPRFNYANLVKGLIPEYAFSSSEYVLSELRENEPFRNRLVDEIISNQLENDIKFRDFWENEDTPERGKNSRQEYRRQLNKNIIDDTARHTYVGKGVKQSLSDHVMKISEKNDAHGIQNQLSLIRKHPEDYTDWFDPDDIKNNNVSEDTVFSLYDSDEDFRKQLIDNQLTEYEAALGTKANQGVFNPTQHPDEYAKAFSIFNRFGSEALTDYTNILQHYVPGSPTQDSRVVSAFRRFRKSPQYRDENPFNYAKEFVGGKRGLNFSPDSTLKPYEKTIQQEAERNGIDPALLAGLVTHESVRAAEMTGGDPTQISSKKGAIGLGQLMIPTAREMGLVINDEVDERKDPDKNIAASAKYLGQLLRQFDGDEELALAAYNAGPTAVTKMQMRAKEQGKDSIRDVIGEDYYPEPAGYIPRVQNERDQIKSDDTETQDVLEFVPKRRIDQRPKDWNTYTREFVYSPEQEVSGNHQDRMITGLNKQLEWISNGEYADLIPNEVSDDFDKDKPLDIDREFEFNRIQHEKAGQEFPKYEHFAYDLIAQSLKDEEGKPSFEDLLATLAANHEQFQENEHGEPIYIMSYRGLNAPDRQHLKPIVDGMITHGAGDSVMRKEGDNIIIEPMKEQRRSRERVTEGFSGMLWKRQMQDRLIVDEGGMMAGVEKHLPNNLGTVIDALAIGFTDFLPEMYGGIVGGWLGAGARKWNEKVSDRWDLSDNFIAALDHQRHKSRDYYSGTLQEFTDPVTSLGGIPFSAPDIGVAGGTLVGYLTGIKAIGKGMVWGAGKAAGTSANLAGKAEQALGRATGLKKHFEALSGQRKWTNLKEFYEFANRSNSAAMTALKNTNRFMTGTQRAILNGSAYGTWPTYVIGSGGVETFTDPQYSLATFTDFLISDAALGLKEAQKWDIDKTYRTAGSVGRWAMDWIAGEMLGILFDGAIGASKLMNDYTLRALRGKPKLGLEFDHTTGKYKPEAESRYYNESDHPFAGARKYVFPEIQRYVFNVLNNANDIPIGNIRDSAAKYARMKSPGPQYYEEGVDATQADIVAKFVDDSHEFMGTVRDDLNQIISDANEKYGGQARLDDTQLRELTNEVYNEFMDNIAQHIYSFTGKSGFSGDRFAEMLETHPATIQDATPIELRGQTALSRTEATIAAKQHPGSHVVPVGDGKYKVYKQDPALWRFDLAQRLRQYSQKTGTLDQTVDEHITRFGLDVSREGDIDDIARVIDTMESVENKGFRHDGREGFISGFDEQGWQVKWDDGSNGLYGEIRGLEGVERKPPKISPRTGPETQTTTKTTGSGKFDEQGVEIEEEVPLRTSQSSDAPEQTLPTLDLRGTREIIDEELGIARTQMSDEARAQRQQELDDLFPDADELITQRIDRVRQLMEEGRHDEAEEVIREISEIRRGQEPEGDAIELPGVTSLRNIVEGDREAYNQYRALRDADDTEMIREYHRERLENALKGGNLDKAPDDIAMLRSMGMDKDAVNEIINENFAGDISKQRFLRNFNESIDFGEGVSDDLLRARVDGKRLSKIRDEAFNNLSNKVKQQMVDQADLLFGMRSVDEPQRLIDASDEEIAAFRSWETANERFKNNRKNPEGLSGREYALQLAQDLGTGHVRDIAKLQKTHPGTNEKVPIRPVDESALFDTNGNVTGIKNAKGLIVKVDPINGDLPFYALGRKNNVRGNPTRFIVDQNGKIAYNQEWAFVNPNVTRQVDGSLRRFNMIELPNGEMVYREARNGKHVLNVQNPIRVPLYDYVGQTLKTTTGKNQTVRGKRTDEILTPERIFRQNVDAIEIEDPRTGKMMYKVVAPEDQALLHGKGVSSPGDKRIPHVLFESNKMPLNAAEAMQRFSREEGKLHSHAWLAVPGLIATGNIGVDENGDLTAFGKAALALGVLGMGGVLIRSMGGQFKIRKGYDQLSPRHKEVFDRFNWYDKVDDGGNIKRDLLSDEESAMFNRMQGVPKDDFALLHKTAVISDFKDVKGKEIPELRGEVSEFRNREFLTWSTGFDEEGRIQPTGGQGLSEQEVIGLELDAWSQGLVSKSGPAHAFTEFDGNKINMPIAWTRSQHLPDGKLLLDEIQVDNALQKGEFGKVGDVNRDLYNSVLDEFVRKAINESGGEFYFTRGDLQAARYGDDPESFAVRNRMNQRVIQRAKELRQESPDVIIREEETVRKADEYVNRHQRSISQNMDSRTELSRALETFREAGITSINTARTLSNIDNLADTARTNPFRIQAVEGGYRMQLGDEFLRGKASREIYESDELAKNMFPRWDEFQEFLESGPKSGGLKQFYDNTLPNIMKKRYGAEITYAEGPGKSKYDTTQEAFHKVKILPEGLERAKGKTGKRIAWETVGGFAGLAGLGFAGHAMEGVDSRQPVDEDTEVAQAGIGALTMILMAGAALGLSKRFRTKIGANVKGRINKGINSVDNVSSKAIEFDGKRFEHRELHELDVTYDPRDPGSARRNEAMLRGAKEAIKAGKSVRDWFRSSGYTQAGTQLLKQISDGIKTHTGTRRATIADKIRDFIVTEHQSPSRYRKVATNHFNETIGYGRGAFQEFQSTRGVEVVKQLADSDVDDATARSLFNQAVNILLDRGIRKINGQGVINRDIPLHIRQVYKSESGELFQGLTRDLLNQEDVVDWATSLKHGYQEVEKEYLQRITGELNRRILRLQQQPLKGDSYQIGDRTFSHDDLMNLTDRWTRTKDVKSYREFVRTLDPDERHLMRIAKNESQVFKDVMEMQHTRRRFTDLSGKYNPQVVDHNNLGSIRQRYIQIATDDPDVMEGMSRKDPESWARLQMMQDFYQVNQKGDGRGLLGFDTDRLDIGGKDFSSADDAQVRLMGIINDGSPREIQDAFGEYMGTTQITPENLEQAGFITRQVNPDGEEVFRIRQPEGFQPDYQGVKHNLFDVENSEQFGRYYESVMRDPAIRRSNFLENPRNFNMPMSWLKNDPMERWRLYTEDVGPRLHALEYGLFKSKDFDTNYMEPLAIAMKNTGFDDAFISKSLGRVDEIFKNQWGIIREISGKSPQEAEEFLRSQRSKASFLQTYRNLDYMKRTYGFGYLNFFQTALTSLQMTSGRALKEAWGMGDEALSHGGHKQFEEMLMDAHVIKEKDLAFRFDQQPTDLTGNHGSTLEKMQRISQKGADGISDFSFKRGMLKMIGVDPGSSRGLRMVTDSFHGTNVLNTTSNAYMFMSEASHYARIGKQMQDVGVGLDETATIDGKVYNWATVYDKLENLGVSRTKDVIDTDAGGNKVNMKEVDYFIKHENQLHDFIRRLKSNDRVSLNDFEPKYADIIESQWHFATESYHGTNKAMRPEKWNEPLGKTLSMYASFTFNAAMQVVRQRTLNPMNTWLTRYATSSDGVQNIGKLRMPLLMKHVRSGNLDALRDLGISDPKRAIAEFPIDAVDNMWRIMAGVGFSIAQYTTLDIMMDLYAYPVNAALGEDDQQFRRSRELVFNEIINPFAPQKQQVTMTELFGGDAEAEDIAAFLGWGLGKLSQSSYGGMYLTPFDSINKYGFNGITSLTPATGIGDRFVSDVAGLLAPIGTFNLDEVPFELMKFTTNNMPVLSSNVFVEQRRSIRNKIDEMKEEYTDE